MKLFKLYFSLVLALMFVLASCSTADNEKTNGSNDDEMSDELVIFNWTDYMPDEIIEGFEEEFDVDVTYSTFASNQEMLSKIQSGTVNYDIAVPSDSYVQVMRDNDLLEKINFDNVPNFENISDEWKKLDFDPNSEYSIVYAYGYDGLIYNKDKIDKPTSWEDLWETEYEGRVVVMEAGDELNDMVQQSMGNDINNPSEEQIKEGGEKLKELMPNVLKFTEAPTPELVSEEAWLVYGYSGEAAAAHLDNDNIEFALPEEGGIRWTDNMVIPKDAENKVTAETFMDYLLRPEVSKKLTEDFPYGNPNGEAVKELDEEIRELPGLDIPTEEAEDVTLSNLLEPEKNEVVNQTIQEAKIKGGVEE